MERRGVSQRLKELLGLDLSPVGLSFVDRPPEGISRVATSGPAGCSYWKSAAEGRVFYTEAADHYSCPIGAWTHHVELPSDRASELETMIDKMVELGYVRREEIPSIPRRKEPFRFVVYGSLDRMPIEPDVVLIRGSARQLMLLREAALAAGAAVDAAPGGRPTCAVIPQSIESGKMAISLACIGNRMYTDAADGEAYCALPNDTVEPIVSKLETVVRANRELEAFHRSRMAELASASERKPGMQEKPR